MDYLLSGLAGPFGNGHLWTLVDSLEGADVSERVLAFLQECGVIDTGEAHGTPPMGPQDVAEVDEVLVTASVEWARDNFVSIATTTIAYRTPGRWTRRKASKVFADMDELLGGDARWWSNLVSDFPFRAWRPASSWINDLLIVGAGEDVIVAVLAVDAD